MCSLWLAWKLILCLVLCMPPSDLTPPYKRKNVYFCLFVLEMGKIWPSQDIHMVGYTSLPSIVFSLCLLISNHVDFWYAFSTLSVWTLEQRGRDMLWLYLVFDEPVKNFYHYSYSEYNSTWILVLSRMLPWPWLQWDPLHWVQSWRSYHYLQKSMELADASSFRHWMIVPFHQMFKRSLLEKTHQKESTRSKEATTALSSQSHSHYIKF